MGIAGTWKRLAIEIGHSLYCFVNPPGVAGTNDETGYVLMFFNASDHKGKSTLVSSTIDRAQLKQLLETALREIDGAEIVGTGRTQ